MNNRKRIVKGIVLCIMVLFLGGLLYAGGVPEANEESGKSETEETTAEKAGTEEKKEEKKAPAKQGVRYPITIEDDWGQVEGRENKTVVLEKPVEKIVVGEKGCALALKEFGVLDRVVGAVDWIINDIPGYEDVASIGAYNVDVERIIGLDPDVFVNLVGHNDKSDTQLLEAGVQIYTVGTVRNLDHIKEHVKTYGLMFDKTEEAEKIIADMEAKEKKAEELAMGYSAGEKPTVFMFGPVGDMKTLQTWAPSGETIVENLITKAGGVCLTAEQGLTGWPQYSLEKLLESDPDVIILPIGQGNFESVESFTSLEIVKDLSAVKDDRVYGIQKDLVFDLSYKNATALIRFAEFINQ